MMQYFSGIVQLDTSLPWPNTVFKLPSRQWGSIQLSYTLF